MYGSIFRLKVLPGKFPQVLAQLKKWETEQLPRTIGVIASYHLQSDSNPDELINVAIFDFEDSYRRNSQVPGQDEWYQGLRELLESDPEWNDGTYIFAFQGPGTGRGL